jgi:hypothetical protein
MTYRTSAIRGAVKGVLEGRLGAVRTVPRGIYKYGTFEGQPKQATQAKALDIRYKHRFDVKIGQELRHASTPVSNLSSYRNSLVPITIDITTNLASTVQEEERDRVRDMAAENADLAMQALAYRGNLLVDETGVPTAIVSGLLQGPSENSPHPEWEVVEENWELGIHRSRINAAAIVQIGQNTL